MMISLITHNWLFTIDNCDTRWQLAIHNSQLEIDMNRARYFWGLSLILVGLFNQPQGIVGMQLEQREATLIVR